MRIAVERKFETGAVVQLNSGGHKMTVSDPYHDDKTLIDVHWLDAHGVPHRDCFHEDCLMLPGLGPHYLGGLLD